MVKTQAYLKSLVKKVRWTTQKTNLPMSQGWAINELIKLYRIPAKSWGWAGSTIGLETNKQYLFWKDNGGELEFLGLVNKSVAANPSNLLVG